MQTQSHHSAHLQAQRYDVWLRQALQIVYEAAETHSPVLVAGVCESLLQLITQTTGPRGRSLIGEANLTLVSKDEKYVGKRIPFTIDSGQNQINLEVIDASNIDVAAYSAIVIRQDSGLIFYLDEILGQAPRRMPLSEDDSTILFSKIIENPDVVALTDSINQRFKGSFSEPAVIEHLYQCVNTIIDRNVPGDILNFGVAWGWSMAFIAEILMQRGETDRRLIGFDTFDGFVNVDDPRDQYVRQVRSELPSNTGEMRLTEENQSYKSCDLDSVSAALKKYPMVEFVVGDVKKTIQDLDTDCISLAFYDMDDYTPTMPTLQPVFDRLSPGGIMMHDHFNLRSSFYSFAWGQRRAMREFLQTNPMFNLAGTNAFIKF